MMLPKFFHELPGTNHETSRRYGVVEAEALEARRLLSTATADLSSAVAWNWCQGEDAGYLNYQVYQQGERIVDLKVQTTSPLTFSAAFVQNSGPYATQWWWNYNQTASQLASTLSSHSARLICLDPYVDNSGNLLFASVMVPNSGPSTKQWWYYFNQSTTDITQDLAQNNGRLIDIEPYSVGGQTYYADVMIANTGADQQAWWWAAGVDPTTISNMGSADNARVVSFSAETNGTFDAILEGNPQVAWWWYYGQSASYVQTTAAENDARIFDLDPYQSGGQTLFTDLMVGNGNSLESSVVGAFGDATAGGETGAYLKQVDGPVLADYNGETQFEPASMIKILLAATALKAVENGQASLTDTITYYYDPNDPTNPGVDPAAYDETPDNADTIDLQDGIGQMLQVSDNRITYALANLFGEPAINTEAQAIGMGSTVWNSVLGSGIPGNYLTLHDDALLYNDLLDGSLLNPAMTSLLESLIWNKNNNGLLGVFNDIISQQAAAVLGVSTSDPSASTLATNFTNALGWGFKGGNYDFYNSDDTIDTNDGTDGGFFQFPVMNADGSMSFENFAYGLYLDNVASPFVNGSPDKTDVNNDWYAVNQALLSGVINEALQTWVPGDGLNPPMQLAFSQQPTTADGATISPSIALNVEDTNGNAVPFNDDSVTLSIASGPAGATLNGVTTVQAQDGIATFNQIFPSEPGTYTLVATDGGLPAVSSQSFTLTATATQPQPPQLYFVQQPGNTSVGGTLSPVTVAVVNPDGSTAVGDDSSVTLSLSSGNINGTLTEPTVNGIATFNDLSVAAPGTYTIAASDGGDTPTASNSFTITAPIVPPPLTQPLQPASIASTFPTSLVAGTTAHGMLTVVITDNSLVSDSGTITTKVFASSDGTIDSSSIQLGMIVRHMKFIPDEQEAVHVALKSLPGKLPAGSYQLLAQVTDASGLPNDAASGPTLTVSPAVIAFSASVSSLMPTDAKAGGHASVKLLITNTGNTMADGTMAFDVSLLSVWSSNSDPVTMLTRVVRIKAGRGATLVLHFVLPSSLSAGQYSPGITISENGANASAIGPMAPASAT